MRRKTANRSRSLPGAADDDRHGCAGSHRTAYANLAIVAPPLKLVLIEGMGEPATLNHLGVEVESTGEVGTQAARLSREGFALRHEDGVTCCYAKQDKFWVTGADRREWEVYTVLADAPETVQTPAPQIANGARCCG